MNINVTELGMREVAEAVEASPWQECSLSMVGNKVILKAVLL